MKGVPKDFHGYALGTFEPEKGTIATKRRRSVKSGADMVLEYEVETDVDDKDIRTAGRSLSISVSLV